MSEICELVRKAAVDTGIFPLGGIRVRAIRCEHFAIADSTPHFGFLAMVLRLGEGRDLATDALEAGMIWLNSENVRHLPTPFGGMKSSGIGRDGGDYSFDFYMETKHVSLARGTHKIQKLGLPSS